MPDSSSSAAKELAARASLEYVRDGQTLGLGSGSTAEAMIRLVGERVQAGTLNVRGVPTSSKSEQLAKSYGIPIVSLAECGGRVDLTIDGADQINPAMQLIKGGGGALLREKIVASASEEVVIIADGSKQIDVFAGFPLPVEVVPFAAVIVEAVVAELGGEARLRTTAEGEPFWTDERNQILDCDFGELDEPELVAAVLDETTGVVDHGLFLDLADVILIGRISPDGDEQVETIRRDGDEDESDDAGGSDG